MRILYAIQGTGNGHLSRAKDIYPELCKYGEVDVLISGIQSDVNVDFPVKYKLTGLSFIFGKTGGIDFLATIRKMRLFNLYKNTRQLNIQQYDLVINDFEPVSAWAAKIRKVPCVSLSHQWAVSHPRAPKPTDQNYLFGKLVLNHYAPCSDGFGFHFRPYGRKIFTPVIRREIREAKVSNRGHITVYLPSYDDPTLVAFLKRFKNVNWEVFSKHCAGECVYDNVHIQPIENNAFIESMASSNGVLCGAGFEGPAEALYLGKKLMVVPMKGQFEQQCNAAALSSMGVSVIRRVSRQYYDRIHYWLLDSKPLVEVDYPDQTAEILKSIFQKYTKGVASRKVQENSVSM